MYNDVLFKFSSKFTLKSSQDIYKVSNTPRKDMSIIEKLEPLAEKFREEHVPILTTEKAEALLGLIRIHKPKRILELGTAVGYSGTILASEGGELLTVDRDPISLEKAEKVFAQFGIHARIFLGDGLSVMQTLVTMGDTFDFFFIDFEKKKYGDAFELCKKLAKDGSVVVFDNAKNHKCELILGQISLKYTTKLIEIGDGMMVVYLNAGDLK
jgi:predicted O-methyltransferase YrrM